MAVFVGTIKEFKKYLGARVRNIVNAETRDYRQDIGKCEHCSSTDSLESAHISGRGRLMIIEEILKDHTYDSQVNINLEQFEVSLRDKHYPLNESIKVLCRKCHTEYDKAQATTSDAEIPLQVPELTESGAETLEISLDPQNVDDFRRALIESRRATIITFYKNGETKRSEWNAEQIGPDSNIFGNLRSRREFRNGNWQQRGIAKVQVKVLAGV
jgi:hypothetical protein